MISSGTVAIGHGGAGERSVGGGSPEIDKVENSASRFWSEVERPCREWWAVLGTVADALEGLGSCGFEFVDAGPVAEVVCSCGAGFGLFLKNDGGKCFALYFSCTLSSSCAKSACV